MLKMAQICPSLLLIGLHLVEISTGEGKEQNESIYKEHWKY